MNIRCPHCGLEHSLFWHNTISGRKELSYFCDRTQLLRTSQKLRDKDGLPLKELKTISMRYVIEDKEFLKQARKANLPEKWSKKLIKSNQDKAQMKLL